MLTSIALAGSPIGKPLVVGSGGLKWHEYEISEQDRIESQYSESLYQRIISRQPEKDCGGFGILAPMCQARLSFVLISV